MSGIFVSLEGIDGCGKSTAARYLVEYLKSIGLNAMFTREPGGSHLAEQIRQIIINESMSSMTELLLFQAARYDHIENVIKPALNNGFIVVCDRFIDSTYAYQGYGRGLINEVLELEKIVLKGFEPDYTLLFDVSVEEAHKRLVKRSGDDTTNELSRFDKEENEFKKRMSKGFIRRYYQNRHRFMLINAAGDIESVQEQLRDFIKTIQNEA